MGKSMTLNEIRALIAESDKTGRPIQYRTGNGNWITLKENRSVSFEDDHDCYRVAPPEPPKPREWWLHPVSARPIPAGESQFIDDTHKQAGWVRVREVMEGEK